MTGPLPRGTASAADPTPSVSLPLPRPVLVAGMGNVLHGDDGFGPLVAQRLQAEGVPDGVRVLDSGIGGIHMVQELMDGFATLLLVDAMDGPREPGTVSVLEPHVPDVGEAAGDDDGFFAETHYAVPAKALILARALAVLPERVYIIGCQPLDTGLGLDVTDTVARSVDRGVEVIRGLLREDAPT